MKSLFFACALTFAVALDHSHTVVQDITPQLTDTEKGTLANDLISKISTGLTAGELDGTALPPGVGTPVVPVDVPVDVPVAVPVAEPVPEATPVPVPAPVEAPEDDEPTNTTIHTVTSTIDPTSTTTPDAVSARFRQAFAEMNDDYNYTTPTGVALWKIMFVDDSVANQTTMTVTIYSTAGSALSTKIFGLTTAATTGYTTNSPLGTGSSFAQATTTVPKDDDDGSGSMIIIIVIVVLLLAIAAGGAAAFYFLYWKKRSATVSSTKTIETTTTTTKAAEEA